MIEGMEGEMVWRREGHWVVLRWTERYIQSSAACPRTGPVAPPTPGSEALATPEPGTDTGSPHRDTKRSHPPLRPRFPQTVEYIVKAGWCRASEYGRPTVGEWELR